MSTITERRQALRDQIWLAGPEHFDVKHLYAGGPAAYDEDRTPSDEWTACFVGHAQLVGLCRLDDMVGWHITSIAGWHVNDVSGWNPGLAYDALVAGGMSDRHAQWHVAVEWLDRIIKGGE